MIKILILKNCACRSYFLRFLYLSEVTLTLMTLLSRERFWRYCCD